MMENKNTFFKIELEKENPFNLETLSNQLDVILSKLDAQDVYKYDFSDHVLCLFKVKIRKRRGQIIRECERNFSSSQRYQTNGIKQDEFFSIIKKLRSYTPIEQPLKATYVGEDLKIFENKNQWHGWQKSIYDMLFDEKGTIRRASDRNIVFLVDTKGCSGKSSFWKYLLFKYNDNIGRLAYATAGQLRSGIAATGDRALWIVDLPRTKGKSDSEIELLSVLEELKSGVVTSFYYGKPTTLLCNPPHIIVSSNFLPAPGNLSLDRWEVYSITKDKCLGKKNQLLKQRIRTDRLNNAKNLS